MKESESEDDVECWQHAQQFSEPWYKSYDRVTRQAASERLGGLLQVSAWHDCSYITGILLLAHGSTVKLSPCLCSHSSLAGRTVMHASPCGI